MSVVLATGGYDHKIRFWEAPSGKCNRTIQFNDSQVNRLEITPDKQFIAAAGNSVVRVYEILSNQSNTHAQSSNGSNHNNDPIQQPALTIEGHTHNVTSIGFQQEGRYLYSGSEDGTVKVWDLRNPKYCRSFDHGGAAVHSVTLRTDREEFVAGDAQGFVKIWDLGGNGCINSLRPSNTTAIQAVDISEDSRTLVAVSSHGTVYVWDPVGPTIATTRRSTTPPGLQSLNDPIHHHRPDNNDNNNDNDNRHDLYHYHPYNTTAAGEHDDDLHNEMIHLLRPVTKFQANRAGDYCLHAKIAPDCRHLVTTGSDGGARLWDTTTWELVQTLPAAAEGKWVWDAAFCADSSYLVTASSDQMARLWNLGTADVVRQYQGHQSAVTCVALNDSNS